MCKSLLEEAAHTSSGAEVRVRVRVRATAGQKGEALRCFVFFTFTVTRQNRTIWASATPAARAATRD